MYAEGTVKNLKSQFRTYFLFCLKFGYAPLPSTSDTMVCFVEYMSQFCGYKHIKHLVGAVRLLHRIFNVKFLINDYPLDTALLSLKRKLANTPLSVFPILPKTLLSMLMFADLNQPETLALWTAWLSGFFLMFRKKSLVPESMAKFDPDTGLTRGKIAIHHKEGFALVYCNHSKVIQYRDRHVIIPLVGIPNSPLNVVEYLHRLFTTNPAPDSAPAFSYLKNGRLLCVTYALFTKKLKEYLTLAGFNPTLYSGHSFRRGGATWAYNSGCDPIMIKYSGDWKTDCFLDYVWVDLEQRYTAQMKMIANLHS